jgi:hypothetical protein
VATVSRADYPQTMELCGTTIAPAASGGVAMMSLVRLLGFTTLGCGCVTGRYREVATNREITYVEEKGIDCSQPGHRRNHTLATARFGMSTLTAKAS